VLIEAGTFQGGSALYFASIFDLLGRGRVVTVDIEDQPGKPPHARIQYLLGSSTATEIVERVRGLVKPGEKVMVVLDSDHRRDHVLQELRLYSGLVSPGCYLVGEDTHFNGHPILPKYGPGPMEAVQEFLAGRSDFVPDRSREKFLMTFNRSGYLKRVR
jgi:cephalosporin hydroxylase